MVHEFLTISLDFTWTSLPTDVQSAMTLPAFRSVLKGWMVLVERQA